MYQSISSYCPCLQFYLDLFLDSVHPSVYRLLLWLRNRKTSSQVTAVFLDIFATSHLSFSTLGAFTRADVLRGPDHLRQRRSSGEPYLLTNLFLRTIGAADQIRYDTGMTITACMAMPSKADASPQARNIRVSSRTNDFPALPEEQVSSPIDYLFITEFDGVGKCFTVSLSPTEIWGLYWCERGKFLCRNVCSCTCSTQIARVFFKVRVVRAVINGVCRLGFFRCQALA